MSRTRWQRLQDLFDGAVELPEHQRKAWLAAQDVDADLREEVLALVATHDSQNESFTARLGAIAEAAVQQPAAGTRLGPYVLVGEIGSGGMGTVFLAERVDAEFDRQVAIKLIRGIPTREASQRLRRERQILANLSHPNIAPLLDGGTTENGQPYLVMEFVDGVADSDAASNTESGELIVHQAPLITDYCRRGNLPRAQRLRLLQQVCLAVHYAHQRLIIHRDLKPANVLVRKDGTPILLDFGIAKLLDAEASGQQTQTGLPWFTPAYASPEQRKGQHVSTATDIYGLGALMHQLLTDQVPQPDAEGRLPAPSGLRRADGERAGDRELDIIVAKATHTEPDRRYASAEALANDIERYLRGRPIQAAPDSVGYRFGKFVRRHRWGVAALVLLIGVILGFIWKLSVENERARRAEAIAQRESIAAGRVVDYLVGLFDAAAPDKAGGRLLSPVELVDIGVRDLRNQLNDEPAPKARLFAALGEISAKLGHNEKGIAAMEDAIALQRQQADPRRLSRYLQVYGNMLNSSGRFSQASSVLAEGIALQEQTASPDPDVMAEMLTTLSLCSGRMGQVLAAIEHAQRALRFASETGDRAVSLRGEASNALSEAFLRNGETVRAIETARRNVAEVKAASGPSTTLQGAREYLAAALSENGEYAEAETLLREVLDERMQRMDADSDWLIALRNQLALVLRNQGKILEAIHMLRANLDSMRARGETETPSYAIALNNLGSLNELVGDLEAAEPMAREALRLALAEGDSASARPDIYRQNLGRVLTLMGRYEEALRLLEQDIVDDGSEDRRIARLRRLVHLAEWHRLNRQFESAAGYLDDAQANLIAHFGQDHPRAAPIVRARALLALDRLPAGKALAQFREAVTEVERLLGPEANPTTEMRMQLAELLVDAGNRDEARQIIESVRDNLVTHFSVRSAASRLFTRLAGELKVDLKSALPMSAVIPENP